MGGFIQNEDKLEFGDNVYIQRIQSGDREAFEVLYRRYAPLAKKLIRGYYLKNFEQEDLIQETMLVCYQTALKFDLTKGYTFGSFFKMNLKNHMFSLIRKDTAQKRRIDKESVSLEAIAEKRNDGELYYHKAEQHAIDENFLVREEFAGYVQELSNFEQEVFRHYLASIDLAQIAELLSCEYRSVKNALERCRKKLKKAFISLND